MPNSNKDLVFYANAHYVCSNVVGVGGGGAILNGCQQMFVLMLKFLKLPTLMMS